MLVQYGCLWGKKLKINKEWRDFVHVGNVEPSGEDGGVWPAWDV